MPDAPESYIHRTGRTARAEAVGDAVTFVTPEEEMDFRSIERAVRRPIHRIDHRQPSGPPAWSRGPENN